jgi:hypothetical protein
MATSTPRNGWPIPDSDDLLSGGADAIAALGRAIDTTVADLSSRALLSGGRVIRAGTATSNASLGYAQWVFQFGFTWAAPPVVIVCNGHYQAQNGHASITDPTLVTRTQFQVTIHDIGDALTPAPGSGAARVNWLAFGII